MRARYAYSLIILLALTLLPASYLSAEEKCLFCHGKAELFKEEATGRKVNMHVETTILDHSAHAERKCTDCHIDVVQLPHQVPDKVNCRRCHYSGNPLGAPNGAGLDAYEHSVHGLEVVGGNQQAPVCQDCHGAHDIVSPTEAESPLAREKLPATCGGCHIEVYAVYQHSAHGEALMAGNLDAPVCSSCHGEHDIHRPTDDESRVSTSHVSETCGECHGPLGVASKYGIKTDRTTTFEESFHGVAKQMGTLTVANCASCHGYHDIRSADDPRSSIHADNIVATCGKPECHPEATAQFASGEIHIDPTNEDSGILYYITKFFAILTISTLAGLLIFILMDLFRRAKSAREKRAA